MAKTIAKTEDHLPATEDYADQFAGQETFTDREHSITPRITILQGLSPQLKKTNPAYIEGAQPGMIFLSSYANPLIQGEEGIVFQPCMLQTPWEVRTDKDKVGVANYVELVDEPPATWTSKRELKGNYIYYETPEGHIAKQIHQHIGLLHIDDQCVPYAIQFHGTGMFISRQWNGLIGSRRTDSGQPAARFTYTYRLKVKTQANAQGEWGQWAVPSPHGKATLEQMKMAAEVVKAFREGTTTVEREQPGERVNEPDDETM
jgi:hypothetical protein